MHPKITLAILIIGTTAVAKGQTTKTDVPQTKGKETLTSYQQGHVYDIMSVDDKMVSLQVDNKKIDPADFHLYDSVLKAINADLREDREHEEQERDEQRRDREQEKRDQEQAVRDREQAVRDRAQAENDRKQAQREQEQALREREQDQKEAARDREEAARDQENDQKQAARDREQAQRDREQAQEDQKQAARDREQGERDREQAREDQKQAVLDREQGERDREQGERDRTEAEEERRMMQDFLNDLVTLKIAPDIKSINSIVLTDTELIVNDKKQTPELQQKMKAKFGKWARCGISYGCCQNSGTSIHFSN